MILSGYPPPPEASRIGTPGGRQCREVYSLSCAPLIRSLVSASAQGWMGSSPGLKSAARLLRYFVLIPNCQIPERSGLPSGFRGAGAVRSDLPSLVRGIPLARTFSHWAAEGTLAIVKSAATSEPVLRFTVTSGLGLLARPCGHTHATSQSLSVARMKHSYLARFSNTWTYSRHIGLMGYAAGNWVPEIISLKSQ